MSGQIGGGRDHLSTVAASFDQRAETYDQSELHRDLAEGVARFVSLADVRVVLDVATGTGLVLRAIALRDARLRLIGLDISAGMLEIARASLPAGEFIECAAQNLPVGNDSVDLITCVTAMHLMADPVAVFKEFARVLAPGGRLVLATFQSAPDKSCVDRPYRTNHPAFQRAELVADAARPFGLTVGRHEAARFGEHVCLLTELKPE